MKVRLSDIPYEGLPVQDKLSVASLNARLQEGSDQGFRFLEEPVVDVVVFRRPHGGEVSGRVTGQYEQPCALCLNNMPRDMSLDVHFFLRARPKDVEEGSEEAFEDDIDFFHYEGDIADLEEMLQELVILSLSIFWHPDVDKTGKCSGCGKRVEELGADVEQVKPATQSLGDLLKKAGLSKED